LLIAISDAACTEADVIRCYGSVTLTAASYTDGSGSKSGSGSSDRDTQCENLRNDYDDCKAQYDTCENPSSSLTNAKDAAQVAYDNSYCSGTIKRRSVPAVLVDVHGCHDLDLQTPPSVNHCSKDGHFCYSTTTAACYRSHRLLEMLSG
ncbi:hypothetical protein BaRGS_00017973, partial [Batillaria attramentaria]